MATDNDSITVDDDLDETEMSPPPVLEHSIMSSSMSRPSFEQVMATDVDFSITIDNKKTPKGGSAPTVRQVPCSARRNPFPSKEIASEIGNIFHETQTTSLEVDLRQLFEPSSDANLWTTLYKVPHRLHQVNEKAYEPNVISIGPYHHGKQHLQATEVIKRRLFSRMIKDKNLEPKDFVETMKSIEKQVRECYEEPLDHIDSGTFVKMMILDGCFIVELIGRSMVTELRGEYDDHFEVNSITVKIMHDLLLLENQLPFFVLSKLFGMSFKNVMPNNQEGRFISMALIFFIPIVPGPGIRYEQLGSIQNIRHLLGLVHDHWLPSSQGMELYQKRERHENEWLFIRSASELREAGIKFEKVTVGSKFKRVLVEGDSLFDIRFENGRMRIPTLSVYDQTERFFRNLMAYEQFIKGPTYVIDYIMFMDSLINSGKDVEILRHRGIINNWLGDDEVVANMFNRLRDFIFSSSDKFYYANAFNDINMHCKRRCNIWKAKLRHNYCNTP